VRAAETSREKIVLVGDAGVIARAARLVRARRPLVRLESVEAGFGTRGAIVIVQPTRDLAARDAQPGRPSRAGGAAQLAWIDFACDAARAGVASALVTGPVSKEAIARSGARGSRGFLGHTEHLARRLGAPEVVMAFACKPLTTALVTTHLPLAKVPRAIRKENVAAAAYHLARLLIALGARRAPTIAVCSLNPHAGEGGLLGAEELRVIAPGIALAQRRVKGMATIVGPIPAETAFRRALAKGYDGVVAMYHDQATIPMKCVAFGDAVNVTLGLPIVRTSVDHGTGYDVAGRGVADARGMIAALEVAARLARAR
jgi:4-hydroxythreonine-4-phosphate dehydrogenase